MVACVILPDVSINNAIEEPSGRSSILQILYQSVILSGFPLSLLTITGPKVNPFAADPGSLDVSLIVIVEEVASKFELAELYLKST